MRRVLASSDESSDLRHKGVEMIQNSLSAGKMPRKAQDAHNLAVSIEECIYNEHQGTDDKYRQAIRSHVFNLKKNQNLRDCVLTGVIEPSKFAHMSSFDMAPERLKRLREDLEKETIAEHQIMEQQGNPTDMFKCSECESTNCAYTEIQKPENKSADQGITVHVYCQNCGHTWKYT